MIDAQLEDIIHQSVMMVRSLLGRSIDEYYRRKVTLASISLSSSFGSTSLATYPITDPMRISIWDPALKEVPVVPQERFSAIRTLYTMSTTQGIATVYQDGGASNAFTLAILTGAVSPVTTLQMTYLAAPSKPATDATYIDLPDHVVPMMLDTAVVQVFRKLSKQPPVEVEQRLQASVQNFLQQTGLSLTSAQPAQVRP